MNNPKKSAEERDGRWFIKYQWGTEAFGETTVSPVSGMLKWTEDAITGCNAMVRYADAVIGGAPAKVLAHLESKLPW